MTPKMTQKMTSTPIKTTIIQYRLESTSYSAKLLPDERVVGEYGAFHTISSWMDCCEKLHFKGRERAVQTKTAHEMFKDFEMEQERKRQEEEKYHKRRLYFQRRALYINTATSTMATNTYTALMENKKDDDEEDPPSSSG